MKHGSRLWVTSDLGAYTSEKDKEMPPNCLDMSGPREVMLDNGFAWWSDIKVGSFSE